MRKVTQANKKLKHFCFYILNDHHHELKLYNFISKYLKHNWIINYNIMDYNKRIYETQMV